MAESSAIRVMIVDDHKVVREGLRAFLKSNADLELVGEAGDGEKAIRLCEQLQPDVVLMDLKMPQMDGVTATHIIRERWPQIQIVALTSFEDQKWVREALAAGMIGYLLKDVSADELATAIQAAHLGHATLTSEAMQALVQSSECTNQNNGLTKRECEVLALVADGLSNQEIAQQLSVGLSTVKTHVSHILAKLDASSRTEAIAAAMRRKMLS